MLLDSCQCAAVLSNLAKLQFQVGAAAKIFDSELAVIKAAQGKQVEAVTVQPYTAQAYFAMRLF